MSISSLSNAYHNLTSMLTTTRKESSQLPEDSEVEVVIHKTDELARKTLQEEIVPVSGDSVSGIREKLCDGLYGSIVGCGAGLGASCIIWLPGVIVLFVAAGQNNDQLATVGKIMLISAGAISGAIGLGFGCYSCLKSSSNKTAPR